MFIERLNTQEIKDFLEWTLSKANLKLKEQPSIYFNKGYGKQEPYWAVLFDYTGDIQMGAHLYDFCCDPICEYKKIFNESWKQYMYSKFGEEYKKAYNADLKAKYENEMIK